MLAYCAAPTFFDRWTLESRSSPMVGYGQITLPSLPRWRHSRSSRRTWRCSGCCPFGTGHAANTLYPRALVSGFSRDGSGTNSFATPRFASTGFHQHGSPPVPRTLVPDLPRDRALGVGRHQTLSHLESTRLAGFGEVCHGHPAVHLLPQYRRALGLLKHSSEYPFFA